MHQIVFIMMHYQVMIKDKVMIENQGNYTTSDIQHQNVVERNNNIIGVVDILNYTIAHHLIVDLTSYQDDALIQMFSNQKSEHCNVILSLFIMNSNKNDLRRLFDLGLIDKNTRIMDKNQDYSLSEYAEYMENHDMVTFFRLLFIQAVSDKKENSKFSEIFEYIKNKLTVIK